MLLSVLLAGSSLACGVDTDSQRPDSGWHIDEDSSANDRPEGLPDQYVDHPISEKRFQLLPEDSCETPESFSDTREQIGRYDKPVVGTLLLLGLSPVEFAPAPIEQYNYNFFVRFPLKSNEWHRFENRPSSPASTYRVRWSDGDPPQIYVRPTGIGVSFTLAMAECQLPTQENVDQFIDEFSEIEIIFHNPETERVFRFEPAEPGAILLNGPLAVLNDHDPALLTWDLPLNRPQRPIPGFLRPRP
jgi:hypothetical protein